MTELIWDGKMDQDGKKSAPLRVQLPFQSVETVNESAQDRQKSLMLFSEGRETGWRNRLIWGDKKYVLPSLLSEFAGKVNLIYIDPPFDTGADFSFQVQIEDAQFIKEPSIIEQKAYRDTWGRGLDSYLQWFYETVLLLHELLAEDGSLYVHLDWHVGHYAKCVLDEVFGMDRFVNEIIWQKIRASKGQSVGYGNVHDSILFYSKCEKYVFKKAYVSLSEAYIKSHYNNVEEGTGRQYQLADLTQSGSGGPRRFGDRVINPPPGKHWIWSQERIDDALKKNQIIFTSGGMPRVKRYLDESQGNPVEDIWTDIPPVNSQAHERTNYPTQKPEALLERIIQASSNEGDLVLDCFCVRQGTGVWTVAPPIDFGMRGGSPPLNPPANGGKVIGDSFSAEGKGMEDACEKITESAPSHWRGRAGVGVSSNTGNAEVGGFSSTSQPEPRLVPIEQVQPGDWVLAHDGKPHRVLRTFKRLYRGRMVGLRHAKSEQTLWITQDHQVLAICRPRTMGGQCDWSATPLEYRERRQQLRKNMTASERMLWSKLRHEQTGYKFRRQHPIGIYIADFYSREANLVVEIDGESHFTPDAQGYDQEREEYMLSIGLKTLRFTNLEVRRNLQGVVQAIQQACRERTQSLDEAQWILAAHLQPGDRVFFGSEMEAVPLQSVEGKYCVEEVYDLEVEETHSFLTEVCAVHNCGSGTTAAVAEKLNRRWIACDLGRFAIHTTRKRLLAIPHVKPFVVQNLGKYERQAWQAGEFGEAHARQRDYIAFILQLYHARPLNGYTWLHGVKNGRPVHVGAVDAPVTQGDVRNIAMEFRKLMGSGEDAPTMNSVDVLGWDFAFELNEIAKQQAAEANLQVRFLRIPRDVMDKRAVEQGDIHFFELASLGVETEQQGCKLTLHLTNFVIPPDDVPADIRQAITHWQQWIDYWAVDWDFQGDTFHNQWQSYRTRKRNTLELQTSHLYEQPGEYRVMVKVIDILGNDTTKTFRVKMGGG